MGQHFVTSFDADLGHLSVSLLKVLAIASRSSLTRITGSLAPIRDPIHILFPDSRE
jgi:hypothetical protein